MVELLNVIENVHKMAQKGDFRNLGIILVQFYENVMMRRQWGYNSFISFGVYSFLKYRIFKIQNRKIDFNL